MKVKVEDLEGLLTQKHVMIVMKVEDPKGLGESLNIQEYLYRLQTFLAPANFENSNVFGTNGRKFGWGQKSVDLIQLSTPKKLAI